MAAMAGTEVMVGDADGRRRVRAAVGRDPRAAIAAIQRDHGLQGHAEILALLDLHKVARGHVYRTLLDHLRTRLITSIPRLPFSKLDRLLEATFPYVALPELQPVVLEVLRRHPELPRDRAIWLTQHPDIFQLCAIEVKRQVWQHSADAFRDRLKPLIEAYAANDAIVATARDYHRGDGTATMISTTRSVTLADATVQEVVSTIGTSLKLYSTVLRRLRALFVKKGDRLLCALRADLLMAFHDASVSDIYKSDPCYKFAWALDTCVRQNHMDHRLAKEIETAFEQLTDQHAYGDIAMIVADPVAITMLATGLVSVAGELGTLTAPKEIAAAKDRQKQMLRLLEMGAQARAMLSTQAFHRPEPAPHLHTVFLPALQVLVHETNLRLEAIARNVPERKLPVVRELSDDAAALLASDALCRRIYLQWLTDLVDRQHIDGVKEHLSALRHRRDLRIADEADFSWTLAEAAVRGAKAGPRKLLAVLVHKHLVPLAAATPATHAAALHALAALASSPAYTTFAEDVDTVLANGARTHPDAVLPGYRRLLDRIQAAGVAVPAALGPHIAELEAASAQQAAEAAARPERVLHLRLNTGKRPAPAANEDDPDAVDVDSDGGGGGGGGGAPAGADGETAGAGPANKRRA